MHRIITLIFIVICLTNCTSKSSSNERESSVSSSSSESLSSAAVFSSSSSTNNSVDTISPTNSEVELNTLTLTYSDGSSEVLQSNYTIYRDDSDFPVESLIVTNTAQMMDFMRVVRGELDATDVVLRPKPEINYYMLIMFGDAAINFADQEQRSYSSDCADLENCDSLIIDYEARTITFKNLELNREYQTLGDHVDDSIIMSGVVTWTVENESETGIPFSSDEEDIAGSTNGASLEDLYGVWEKNENETGGDQTINYTVYDDENVRNYRYLGSSSGENCYEVQEYSITDLGDGVFNTIIPSDYHVRVQSLIEKTSEDELMIHGWVYDETATLTDLSVSDLVPVCETL